MSLTFHRIVHAATKEALDLEDFMSDKALGEEPPQDPKHLHVFDGISVFATEQQARNKATDYPRRFGRYIAIVELEDGAPIRVERTLSTRGHHTLWGEPSEIRRRVVSVVPV